jgi:hypothetical protein
MIEFHGALFLLRFVKSYQKSKSCYIVGWHSLTMRLRIYSVVYRATSNHVCKTERVPMDSEKSEMVRLEKAMLRTKKKRKSGIRENV